MTNTLQNILKIQPKLFADHVPRVVLHLVGAKVPLSEMCWSHRVDFCGQNCDIWELLDYRFCS